MDRHVTGLLGSGIQGSLSPPLHEREADINGLRYIYQLIDLEMLGLPVSDSPLLISAARRMGFSGLNVTHPCKQAVLPGIDALTDEAAIIGAVNTITFTNGKSIGNNTDWAGFCLSLEHGLPEATLGSVVVLGAGGAGGAASYALLRRGTSLVTIFDIDRGRRNSLVNRLRSHFAAERVAGVAGDGLGIAITRANGLVNATPVGMVGSAGLPCRADLLHPDLWVVDVVYRPLDTEFLQQARRIGCRTLNGGPMLVHQAAEAFNLFTGIRPDAGRMLAHFAELTG